MPFRAAARYSAPRRRRSRRSPARESRGLAPARMCRLRRWSVQRPDESIGPSLSERSWPWRSRPGFRSRRIRPESPAVFRRCRYRRGERPRWTRAAPARLLSTVRRRLLAGPWCSSSDISQSWRPQSSPAHPDPTHSRGTDDHVGRSDRRGDTFPIRSTRLPLRHAHIADGERAERPGSAHRSDGDGASPPHGSRRGLTRPNARYGARRSTLSLGPNATGRRF
jgi:hypothetical protein